MSKKCPVTQGKVDLTKYDKLDVEWKRIGLPAPARRALVNAKLLKINDLKKVSEDQLAALHGMGPSSIPILKKEMKKQKIKFKA